MNTIGHLIYEFFLTGLFSIGGGLATLPFLRSIAERYPWFTPAELTNMIALSESTPGPLGINMATFAGFRAYGFLGAALSTLFLVLPSYVVIVLISSMLQKFRENELLQNAFYALRPASAGMIIASMMSIILTALFHTEALQNGNLMEVLNIPALLFFTVIYIVIVKKPRLHPIFVILSGMVFGILFRL